MCLVCFKGFSLGKGVVHFSKDNSREPTGFELVRLFNTNSRIKKLMNTPLN